MITGVGVDIVEIKRMQKAIDEWGGSFLEKVFTQKEITYSSSKANPTPHIAARFAVKEAVAKALRTGWSGGFRWKDIEVENDAEGRPQVLLYGTLKGLLGERKVHISLSHSENVVVAVAVLEE